MLLTDEEIAEISLSAVTVKDAVADALAVEAAVLAKLASAELPEPELHDGITVTAKGKYKSTEDGYTADQLRQAYAHGAAAQLDRLEKAEKEPEITPAMIEAAESVEDLYRRGTPHTWGKVFHAMWRAMEASK